MINFKKTFFGVITLLTSAISFSADFGVMGDVWPIAEPDVRKTIVKDLMKVDANKQNELLKQDAKSFMSRLPKRGYGYAPEKEAKWIDVSVELSQDISAPVKDDMGGYSWKLIAKKGDKINPLKTKSLGQLIYFFNGADPAQVALLKELFEKEPILIMPVEAGAGDMDTTSKLFDRPIFYAPDFMINQFKVQYLPTIAFQGAGTNSYLIKTVAYPQAVSAQQVLEDWDSWPHRPAETAVKVDAIQRAKGE